MNTLIQLLELLLLNLHKQTCYYSDFKLDHPYYLSLLNLAQLYPQQVIPWLLENCSNNWYCICALKHIVPKEEHPEISEEMSGRLDLISAAWLACTYIRGNFIIEPR